MLRQKQRRDFAISRQDIADFHAEHFENGIARRDHLHFRNCASISASWARACVTRICAAATFFSCALAAAVCAFGIIRGNDFALKQILLTPRVVAQEFQLRLLRISVVNRGVNLCGGKIAACSQFGSVQFHDRLAGTQSVPFPCENLFHASGAARSHVHFVHFNGPRNRLFAVAAPGEQEKERQSSRCAHQASIVPNK